MADDVARQKFQDFYEEAYAGELKSIIERAAAWKFWKAGMREGETSMREKAAELVKSNAQEVWPRQLTAMALVPVIRALPLSGAQTEKVDTRNGLPFVKDVD